jgi:hypothetical protein
VNGFEMKKKMANAQSLAATVAHAAIHGKKLSLLIV